MLGGIYLHVPFCRRVCPYCDFAVRTGGPALRRGYVEHLIAEIGLHAGDTLEFDTVYFGGGTPSLLPAEDLARILAALRRHLRLRADAGLFLEANPEEAGGGDPPMSLFLIGEHHGKKILHAVKAPACRVGRDPASDLVLPSQTVSR